MKLARSILWGAAALGFTAVSAPAMDESTSSIEEAYDMAYSLYGVDDDRDGRPDRYLIIEQRDTLASPRNDADLENPFGG